MRVLLVRLSIVLDVAGCGRQRGLEKRRVMSKIQDVSYFLGGLDVCVHHGRSTAQKCLDHAC